MRQIFETVYGLYAKLLSWLAIMAGFAFFAMMWLIDANALSRRLFNAPIAGTLEITEALMVIAIMMPMAYTQLVRGHIRVTLLIKNLPDEVQRYLLTFALVVGFVFTAWAAYAAYGFFLRSYNINEHAWGSVRFPIYPSKGAVALGLGLLSIQFLLDAIRVGIFRIAEPEEEGDEIDMNPEARADG